MPYNDEPRVTNTNNKGVVERTDDLRKKQKKTSRKKKEGTYGIDATDERDDEIGTRLEEGYRMHDHDIW